MKAFQSSGGLVGAFEIICSLSSEEDVILRRTAYLGHEVYLYPLVTPPDEVRAILRRVLETLNDLEVRPRFYHSVTDNCTSRLKRLANEVRPRRFPPFRLAQILPGRTDTVLYRKGWLETDVPLSALRESCSVRAKAARYAADPDFSRRIREP